MKLFLTATPLCLLAIIHIVRSADTTNTYTSQFCFTRYSTESVASLPTTTHTNNLTIRSVTVSTLNPSNVIEVTPSPIQTTITENGSDVTVTHKQL